MVIYFMIVFECVNNFGSERVMTAIGEVDVTEPLEQLDFGQFRVMLLERVEVFNDIIGTDEHVVHRNEEVDGNVYHVVVVQVVQGALPAIVLLV
jgi:hypothetical protein